MPDRMNDPLAATAAAQAPRLRAFVRRQVEDLGEVDDIVQDVLFELVAAYRLMQPIEHVTAWLLRVARNRIIDRYRAGAREAALIDRGAGIDRGALDMTETMPEPDRVFDTWVAPLDAGPEAAYVRSVLIDELLAALNELPGEQRDVFMAHELDGRSFKELAAATGVSLNTLLGRKHAAVNYLRRRLRDMHSAFDH
ncbi:MAG TPA: RNA polymerase sigma factor [Steroidobacteraceae bacterium]|nr:RNA polymerase sigma factor [Steroidobacteraceae bacterium]